VEPEGTLNIEHRTSNIQCRCNGDSMRKSITSLVWIALFFTTGCTTEQHTDDLPEVTMARERVQILVSENSRYSKHGWNHYGPG